MVFLLGRMGNNRDALTLIIERLGDVHRAIEFAKEQSDDDLWEDLLKYSETRPSQYLVFVFLSFFLTSLSSLHSCAFGKCWCGDQPDTTHSAHQEWS